MHVIINSHSLRDLASSQPAMNSYSNSDGDNDNGRSNRKLNLSGMGSQRFRHPVSAPS